MSCIAGRCVQQFVCCAVIEDKRGGCPAGAAQFTHWLTFLCVLLVGSKLLPSSLVSPCLESSWHIDQALLIQEDMMT